MKLKDLINAKLPKQTNSNLTKSAIQHAMDKTENQRYFTNTVKRVEITRG